MYWIERNESTYQIIYHCTDRVALNVAKQDAKEKCISGEYDLRYWQIVFTDWGNPGGKSD